MYYSGTFLMEPYIYNNYDLVDNINDDGVFELLDNLVLAADYQGFNTYLFNFQSFVNFHTFFFCRMMRAY